MFLVDSHCHLDSLNYDNQSLKDVLAKANEHAVKHCLSVATTLSGYQSMRTWLAPYFGQISLSCGVHPLNLQDETFDLDLFKNLAQDEHVVALGETGLDYYYQQDHIQVQQAAFAAHIRLGRELQKPVIVHTRQAKDDTLAILKDENVHSGVLHCFTEDLDTAKKLLDLGLYISFSGIVTFKNAESIREVARFVPLDRLLIETDSPYLAPVPYRGKENQPAHVRQVAEYLAVLKQQPVEIIAEKTTENFCHLFGVRL
ncbi:TatD DNase family protein [Orbus hercynius]|uniref:TatD DNase family protein n=1 Tax=Orbus hercynius TaxID=593135 RepID=A0A495RK54_9GAMM|nr:YchF/TatD family DNA exonuclease [Orbus hercynius]RKS87711.1 TatD DNase family protein [Orbus hercynius]